MRRKPDDFYAAIADDYLAAIDLGLKPTKAIAEAYDVPHTTAAGWVARARRLGCLDATLPRTVPGAWRLNRKLLAVAEALGVTSEALAEAVAVHANGDLRLSRRG